MGTRGREIVGENLPRILELLNKAFADEWLAYYQYWIGAKVVQGPMKDAVIAELLQHAADELRHADMVTARIIQLGGTPVTSPAEWLKWSNCGYDAPDDPFVQKILQQNISGEQCAINVYNSIIQEIGMKDPV
ncbi:MAG: ferritin, partial [Chlorobiaceae bacterium]|nr:ferritin [Chlorobiaceae bacterium]